MPCTIHGVHNEWCTMCMLCISNVICYKYKKQKCEGKCKVHFLIRSTIKLPTNSLASTTSSKK